MMRTVAKRCGSVEEQENHPGEASANRHGGQNDAAPKQLGLAAAQRRGNSSVSWTLPLGEQHLNVGAAGSPLSSAKSSAPLGSSPLFSPPASSASSRSALTTACSTPQSSTCGIALPITAASAGSLQSQQQGTSTEQYETPPSKEKKNSSQSDMASYSTPSSSSPSKLHACRTPSLDVITARLRSTTLTATPDAALSAQASSPPSLAAGEDSSRCASSSPSKRGRGEALASLRDRAVNRSRSTSPVKKSAADVSERLAGREAPSLHGIALHLRKREQAGSRCSSSGSLAIEQGKALLESPVVACSPGKDAVALAPSPAMARSELPAQSKSRDKASKLLEWRTAELARRPQDHPLEHTWGVYFDSKANSSNSGAASKPLESPTPQTSAQSWESTLRVLGHYVTVQSFMNVFRTLRRPSQLERNSTYHLFKDGIKPMWEDAANANGGKWVLSFRGGNMALLDRSWMWLVLALIGEELDENDDITGAVVSLRPKGDRIALWIRDKEDVDKINAIGRRFVSLLEVESEAGVSLEFSPNTSGEAAPSLPVTSDSRFLLFDNPVSPAISSPMVFASFASPPAPHHAQQGSGTPQSMSTLTLPSAEHMTPRHHQNRSPAFSPASQLGQSPSRNFVATLRANNQHAAQNMPTLGGPRSPGKSTSRSNSPLLGGGGGGSLSRMSRSGTNVGLGFSMGLGGPIGREASPTPPPPPHARPAFPRSGTNNDGATGLFARPRSGIDAAV